VDGRIILRWMEGRNVQSVLIGNFEGKRPQVILRPIWEDNIKMDRGHKCAQVSGRET
jgi:hypothetical protein